MSQPRMLNELESMALHAENCWSQEGGVREDVADALDKCGLTIKQTVEEYYASEYGVDSPEYEESRDDDEFSSISSWTDKGNALLKTISQGIHSGELIYNPKYEGAFE